jgi:hypothetical protein
MSCLAYRCLASNLGKRLEELGLVWDMLQQVWEVRFQELEAYKNEHDDCLIPSRWKENQPLAQWVTTQRSFKRTGDLDEEKFKRLDELGFVWEPNQQAWEMRFEELVSYKQEYGDCLVPKVWENQPLATWIGTQRTLRKKSKLDAEKIKRLDELGFVWDTRK